MMLKIVTVILIHNVITTLSSHLNEGPIVEEFSISPFLDHNHYIRLNLSWREVLSQTALVSIRFKNSEDCNPINDIEDYPINNNQYLIIPSMEMEHPADNLIHGCKYEITLEDDYSPQEIQQLFYVIPECVEDKCTCRDARDSPYKVKSITPLPGNFYLVSWQKLNDGNLTVHHVYYQRKDMKTKIYIPEKDIIHEINSMKIPLPDLKRGVTYRVSVVFIDRYNECIYYSSADIDVPVNNQAYSLIYLAVVLVLAMVFSYSLTSCSPKWKIKISNSLGRFRKMISCIAFEESQLITPLSSSNTREECNVQYTPLEFVLAGQKYDEYEFPRNKLLIKDEVGQGAFGKVYCAKAFELSGNPGYTMVAVKKLREGAPGEEINDFYNEIGTLKKVGQHENIVKLLGCVTLRQPYMMIMELVPCGSLKSYLVTLRQKWKKRKLENLFFPKTPIKISYTTCVFDNSDCSYIQPDILFHEPSSLTVENPEGSKQSTNRKSTIGSRRTRYYSEDTMLPPQSPLSINSSKLPSSVETISTTIYSDFLDTPAIKDADKQVEPVLDHKELQHFALQIANGMAHLENIGITHRDLAARNVLITSDKILKISDFGMSRMGTYVTSKGRKLPLRWMSIEAIEERTCDSKSDVWSFGVVLWEIGTLGGFPYERTTDTLILHNLKMGKRLERPEICTDELYSLMMTCWSAKPIDRPSFRELVDTLNVKKPKAYIDFAELCPKYVFPPTDPQTSNASPD